MTKNSLNKRNSVNYNDENLKLAINDVQNKVLSIRSSEKKYGVPRNTISRHIKHGGNLKERNGPKTILTAESEIKLANWLIDCAKKGDPRTYDDLKIAANDFDKYENNPPKFGLNGPSKKWLRGFFKRHSSVTIRTPENLCKASATVTQEDINKFFSKFYSYIIDNGHENIFARSDAFYNLDETSFDLNQVPRKVLAKKGQKSVYSVNSTKEHDNVTTTFIFCANGEVFPPQIIFKESFSKLHEVAFAAGELQQKYYFCQTPNGWQTKTSFDGYIRRFDEELKARNVLRPVVLFMDGHPSHINLDLYDWCLKTGIILCLFYPNATHILQMADVSMFGPAKAGWRKETLNFKHQNNKRELNQVDFIQILSNVIKNNMKPESIKNGFASTGIFPFNPQNIHNDRIIGIYNENTSYFPTNNMDANTHENLNSFDVVSNEEEQIENDQIFSCNPSEYIIDVPTLDQSLNHQSLNISSIISQMKLLSNNLVNECKSQNHPGYLNALVIQHELNLMQPTIIDISTNMSLPVEIIKPEPQLPQPNIFSKSKTVRRRKFNYGVVNSYEILETLKKDEKAKLKVQEKKEQRKLIREEKKQIKEVSLKIKQEKDDNLIYGEPKVKKRRGRPQKKSIES